MPSLRPNPSALEKALRFRFRDAALRDAALTHRSFSFEQGRLPTNERLEFLGDAVLGMVIADISFRRLPDLAEGQLARLRAATVNTGVLADVARELGLGEELLLGRGEEISGGRDKSSILADSMEAVLGAVYLDRGFRAAYRLIDRLFWPRARAYVDGGGARDYKSALQELAAQSLQGAPVYRLEQRGPDHEKEYTATVQVGGRQFGQGTGRSKKEAEQQAAREAYTRLSEGLSVAEER